MKTTKVRKCPGCQAKFQRDAMKQLCKACGLPDEVAARGTKALRAWQKAQGAPLTRGGSFQRRRPPHGRARGGSKRVGAR